MKPILVATAAMISVMLLTVAGAGAAMQCYECHGTSATMDYRPVDASYRNISTGGFKGNHQTHMGSAASSADCAVCHGGGATSYLNSHRNGQVSIAVNINNSPATGTYSRGTSFAQSTTPTLGTCSSVNCHFESATLTWGADPSLTTCSTCHGAAPADGSHPATSGSGKKHGDYYGLTTSSCSRCHPDHTGEARPFTHATSAGNRALLVVFNTTPNSGFGRYTGNTNYPNYLPSQSPPRNGTCKNLYCHSPGNKASSFDPPNTSAVWGGSLTCAGCHKADNASGSAITSGSHLNHVYGTSGFGAVLACVKCHGATAGNGMAIVDLSRHVDKQVTIAFNSTTSAAAGSYSGTLATPASPMTKAPGSSYATCSTVYCHSTGQGAGGSWPPAYTTPTWGSYATGECGTCHGIQKKHGTGAGFNIGTPTPLASGSHAKHLAYTMSFTSGEVCAACHASTLAGFSPAACSSAACHDGTLSQKHPNYAVNVGIPNYYGVSASYSGTSKPGDGYGSCSSNYCHSDGKAAPATYATPTWGNAASGACGTCHGVTAAAPPASTPHVKHVGSANVYFYKCALCHSGKAQVTANSTIAPAFTNLTSHVNKVRDVKFDAMSPFGTYSSASQSCRNVYCHSVGNTNVTAGALPGVYGGKIYTRQTWSGTLSCNGCHGRSTGGGMPDYTNGGVGATANTHPKHVTEYSISCGECHSRTTKNGTTIRTVFPSAHVNASPEVFFNLSSNVSKLGSYDSGQKSCSSVDCHSDGKSIPTYVAATTWGDTLTCTGCHGNFNTNGGAGTALSGKHAAHVNSAAVFGTNTGFGCEACHAKTVSSSTTVSSVANHVNRFIDYSGAFANDNYDTGTKACTNIYCHSNGNRESLVYVNPAVWSSATTYGCNGCHGTSRAAGEPDYANGGAGSVAANSHALHLARLGTYDTRLCSFCHANTVDNTTANKLNGASPMRHINGTVDVNPGGTFKGVAVSFTYNAGTGTCATISCHGNTSATWGGTACLGCHSVIQGNRIAVKTHFDGQSHHVQGTAVTDDKCYQCHWESDSSGYLVAAYHGGTATSTAGVTLVVHGAGSRPTAYAAGAFVAYTSGGASNSTRAQLAKINTHCISCHKTANDSYTPFGDGKIPKQYAWDNTSVDSRYSQTGTTTWGKYPSTTNASKKNITKAYSAHGKATSNARGWDTTNGVDGTITNTAPGSENVLCFDCHNSHGTTATGVMSSYSSATGRNRGGILKSTSNGKGGYTATYTPAAGGSATSPNFNAYNPGADLCFDCHNTQTKSASIPWGYNSEFGVTAGKPVYGYWDTANFGDGLFGPESRYAYKALYGANKGGHFGKSSAMNTTPSKQINGLCTPCHDPHGVSTVTPANQPYMVPLLKGTWVTSPYKEDSAPAATNEDRGGASSRGPSSPVNTSSSTPNYHIDQNTFQSGTTYWAFSNGNSLQTIADTNFAGLCLQCHAKANIDPDSSTTWKSMDRVHDTVKGWGGNGANAGNAVHAYTCSKCHAPHNARLPRLMVTNCLDAKHRNRSAAGGAFSYDSASDSRGAGGGRGPMGGGGSGSNATLEGPWFFCKNSSPAESTTSNIRTCHNVAGAAGTGTTDDKQQWNSKTHW